MYPKSAGCSLCHRRRGEWTTLNGGQHECPILRSSKQTPLYPAASKPLTSNLQRYIYKYDTYMLTFLVIVSRQPARSAPRSRLSTSSQVTKCPVVHPLSIHQVIKWFFRNSFVLKTIHFDGGGVPLLAVPLTATIPSPVYAIPYPLFVQAIAHSFALFCTRQNLNSFVFRRFRTLRQKTQPRGWGEGATC